MKTLKQLLEERAALHDSISAMTKTAETETRDLSEEEEKRCDELLAQSEALSVEIEKRQKQSKRSERIADLQKRTAEPVGSTPRGPEPTERADITDDPEKRYSLLRAINLRVSGLPLDGFEAEVSQEIEKRTGKSPSGFYLPTNLQVETRDLTTTTGAGAIGTTTATTMIELLRNKMVTQQLGARVMSGMVGNFEIPKQTGTAQTYWVTEGSSPTKSNATVGQVELTPNTVGTFTDLTRRLIKQSSFDAENFARDDLMRVMALGLDLAALNGSGSGAEPEGVLQNSNVPTVAIGANGGAPTFSKIVEMETVVATKNADQNALAYLTTASARGKCKTTEKATNTAKFLWDDHNLLNGYPAHVTNQLPADLTKGTSSGVCSSMIFGDWSQLVFALWSAVDILVDPYTNSTAGTVRIVALQDADIKLRHDESFAKIVDITTT